MSVPDFQQFFLPILQVLAHGKELRVKDVTPLVCDKMGISAEDRLIKLQSGQTRVYDRTTWGITYLRKAKLIDSPKRGIVKINDEGRKVLAQKLDSIDMKFLEQYPGYIAFKNLQGTKTKPKDGEGEGEDGGENGHLTPDESIEKAYKAWRQALVDDVLETVINCSPDFFERLVVELLVAMGYGGSIEDAGKAVGKTGDGGIVLPQLKVESPKVRISIEIRRRIFHEKAPQKLLGRGETLHPEEASGRGGARLRPV
jgi:restriction system protein